MARYNEILTGRFNRFAQKIFSMKGPANLVSLGDELHAVFPYFSGSENRYLESWNLFGLPVTQPGAAANVSGVRLRNPLGSNVVAVVTKVHYFGFTVADTPSLQVAPNITSDLANILSNTGFLRFDARWNNQNPACVLSAQSTPSVATIGGTKDTSNVAIAQSIDVILTDFQEFPLLPGDTMQVISTAVNITIGVEYWWRERTLEESERT